MGAIRGESKIRRAAESERERDQVLFNRLLSGESIGRDEILGAQIAPNAAIYPAGLVLENFLPLSVALSPVVLLRVPSLFSFEEFEETLGMPYKSFLALVDRGALLPILNDYELYEDPRLIAPVVAERRPHLTEQRVTLSTLSGLENGIQLLVAGLRTAVELFPSTELRETDLGDEIMYQGIHVGFALLSAIGYSDGLQTLFASFGDTRTEELLQPVARFMDHTPTEEDFRFVLTTFLSGFFTDCVGLGATGHFDYEYESVLRIPENFLAEVLFLPTSFGSRLVDRLDISIPRRLESSDVDDLVDSDVRAAIGATLARFKAKAEISDFSGAAGEGAAIRDEIAELGAKYQSMKSLKKFGGALSSVSFGAVPLTIGASLGLLQGIVGGLASVSAQLAASKLEKDDFLAKKVINPLLRRFSPWRMDAATFSLCQLKEHGLS